MLRKLQRASDRGFLLLQVFPLYLGQMALARYMGIASRLPISEAAEVRALSAWGSVGISVGNAD
jgi:hypothetical protein